MTDWPPPIEKLVSAVAKLHQEGSSPNGMFGFKVPTYCGTHEFNTQWSDSWEEVFARQFREEWEWENSMRGSSEELDELIGPMFEKVIPRLLRPLQLGGRSIKPTLCHGDLWHGNVGVDVDTDDLILYDPCAVYAHNECECILVSVRYLPSRYNLARCICRLQCHAIGHMWTITE